jgi:hypothetical protein
MNKGYRFFFIYLNLLLATLVNTITGQTTNFSDPISQEQWERNEKITF